MGALYYLEIDRKRIGYTEFEHADPPMGVLHGKIVFDDIEFPYEFFKAHCLKYKVKINFDDLNERCISTVIIPQLKVCLQNGDELPGWGGAITGMESDIFEIDFYGVSPEVMQAEFEHHLIKYERKYKPM